MDELRKIAADLREARRYARTRPDVADRMVRASVAEIGTIVREVGGWEAWALERLAANLNVGLRFVRSMPEMLQNYLANSAIELETLAGPIEVAEVAEVVGASA